MAEKKLTPDEERLLFSVYAYAAEQMKAGYKDYEIADQLTKKGLPSDAAWNVVRNLSHMRNEAERKAGERNMAIGGVVCLIGLVVTCGSYMAANDGDGGSYIVAWGAIIFGAFQFVRGLMQTGGG